MATSLSIDSSPSALYEHAASGLASGLAAYESTLGAQSKKYQSASRIENQGSVTSAQGASQSSANNNVTSKESNARGNSLSNTTQYQQQSLLTNTALNYPLLTTPYYGHPFYQSIATPTTQAPASYYSGNTMNCSQGTSAQGSSTTSNNRRGGKKKAPLAQQQNSQYRIFFNLKKKEATYPQRGPSHMYKPKNPPSITEWFKRLSVEERINSVTTIYPILTETLINMNKRIEQSGRHHSFALKDPIYYDHKSITPMFYSQSYAQALFPTVQSSSSNSFEENFYYREQNEAESGHLKNTEKEKFESEQEIIKHVQLTDFNQYLDTLTVAPELVNNADYFFKLMANVSNNLAFKSPCQFLFDQKSQVNSIEAPGWFKPKSFHSFATWIVVALEEALWAHYNYDTNQNLSQAKANEMTQIFKDKSESPDSDVQPEALGSFWREMNIKNKKELLEQLKEKASKLPKENLFQLKGKNQTTLRTTQARDFGYCVRVVEFNRENDVLSIEEDDFELTEIVNLASQPDKENEMLAFLVLSPLKRAEKRSDKLCREFYKCIKQKYQEELVEILLKEEQQSSRGEGKRKRKKNSTQQNSNEAEDGKVQEQQETTDDAQAIRPKKKKNKKTTANTNHAYLTSEEHKSEKLNDSQVQSIPRQGGGKKKKRPQKQGETKASSALPATTCLEAHSCDDKSCEENSIQPVLEIDNQCASVGKRSSTFCDKTTAPQSITTLSNSSSLNTKPFQNSKQTLSVTKEDSGVLILSQSRSVDCHSQVSTPMTRRDQDSMQLQIQKTKSISAVEELNINKYVRELTNQMIDEVCQKFESDSSNSKKERSKTKDRSNLEELKQKQKKFNASFYQIGAGSSEDQDMMKQRKPSFKRKHRKESNLNNLESEQGEQSQRKPSFNLKMKEDKKFIEDYQQNSSTQLLMQTSSSKLSNNDITSHADTHMQSATGKQLNTKGKGKGSTNIGQKSNQGTNSNRPKPSQPNANNSKTIKTDIKDTGKGKNNQEKQVKVSRESMTDTQSVMSDAVSQNQNDGQQQKKKRNRKKVKQNDADIMNNFMKSLSIQPIEIPKSESEKQSKTYCNTERYQKKPMYQPKNQQDTGAKEQTQYKQKASTTTLNKYNSEKPSDVQSQKGTKTRTSLQISEPVQQNSEAEQPISSSRSYQKPVRNYQKNSNQGKAPVRELDSMSSHLAETRSDNGQNYYSQRGVQQKFKPKHHQSNQGNPFKYGAQKKGADKWETTSFTATSNTAEESSTDNNNEKRKYSGGDSNILIQDQLMDFNQDQKQEVQTLPPALTDDALLHTKSQVYQLHTEDMIPPQIQTPESCVSSSQMSTQAQCFTPKVFQNQNSYYSNTQRRMTNTMIASEYNKNGCQSFQNTPNKKGLQPKPTFKPTLQSTHSYQAPPISDSNYKSPNMKASPSNYSQGGVSHNPFRKQSQANNDLKSAHQKPHFKPHRPTPQVPQSHYQHQPVMNMQYQTMAQQYYYGSQEAYIPRTQQPYYQPPMQEGVFQYQDPAMHMMTASNGQIHYTPNLYPHNSQQYDYAQPECMASPMSTSLTNEQLGFVDHNSQEFFYQIMNSLSQVHQPMSPVPMNFTSPPPIMMDYQQNCLEAELYQLAIGMDPQSQENERKFFQKFDEDIYSYCAQVQANINLLKPERDYVFDKIDKACFHVFPNQTPKLILFGSLSTGLALESSDMDLAVTGLVIEDRYDMIQQLQTLAQELQSWGCLVSFKVIDTASIPVIKIKLDINKLRTEELGKEPMASLSEEQNILSIDITFDDSSSLEALKSADYGLTKTHLGLQSCQLVQNYVASYPHLKEVAILLKKFLAVHNFNSPYYGGLSSYSTVLLLVAYMNYYQLRYKQDLTPSRLLMGYLNYFGNYFSPSSMGISTYQDGSFYPLQGLLESNLVILDPLNLQNNTTKNSYHTKEILKQFQCAFNNLKSLMLPQFQNKSILKGVFNSNSKDSNVSPLKAEMTASAGMQEQISNTGATYEDSFSGQNVKNEQEEKEASSQVMDGELATQQEELAFSKMNLLEIFLAKETQQITILSGEATGSSESKCTHVTQISLTEALAGTVV